MHRHKAIRLIWNYLNFVHYTRKEPFRKRRQFRLGRNKSNRLHYSNDVGFNDLPSLQSAQSFLPLEDVPNRSMYKDNMTGICMTFVLREDVPNRSMYKDNMTGHLYD